MNRYNPVDINRRVESWRQSGWTGYDANSKPFTAKQSMQEREQYQQLNTGNEVKMPVVEEEVVVGKRQVQSGGVQVHRRVTERPVEQDVTLRQERVNVERRPVDRPADPGMLDNMRDKSIEVTAQSEEAVVQKRARVVEEVVVNKDVNERTEKVRETARRSDVDVQQTNGGNQEQMRTGWREHYQSTFGRTGRKYETYEPAYQYGHSLHEDRRYKDYDWNRLEPEARRTWSVTAQGR
jgi:uncharacterized protein (TIGR02271 family)